MKFFLPKAFLCLLLLAGCQLENPQPSRNNGGYVVLTRVATTQGDSREFIYSPEGWLTRIIGHGSLALNENQTSTSTLTFDSYGRISTILTDGPDLDTKNLYHYTPDHLLVKLEEKVQDQLQSYHTFAYDAQKRLATRLSFYPDLASGALRETNKSTYTYDANGNLLLYTHYTKPTAAADWQLSQTHKYENYDTQIGVHHFSSGFLFTPGIVLHKNNPGKVTTTLASGEVKTATFTYQYNAYKLPTKKTTTPDNGNSFETVYTYQL